MKPCTFLGDSLASLRAFPADARADAGFQIRRVQPGAQPSDWKPMPMVGAAVREIRIREASGSFRVIYLAEHEGHVLILHAFQKKTQKTAQRDLLLAAARLNSWRR